MDLTIRRKISGRIYCHPLRVVAIVRSSGANIINVALNTSQYLNNIEDVHEYLYNYYIT